MNIWNIYDFFIKILTTCLICKSNNNIVCDECEKQFIHINYDFIDNREFFNIDKSKFIIPYKYDFPINNLILQFKYGNKYLLADYFAKKIHEICQIPKENMVYIPIPVSTYKLLKRGYNQTFLLSKSIITYGKRYKNYYNNSLEPMVFSTSNKNHNVNSEKDQRKINAEYIKLNDITPIINKSIILVDDVMASGSTIRRCISLIEPYVNDIYILCIAKT